MRQDHYRFQFSIAINSISKIVCDSRPLLIVWKRGSKTGETQHKIISDKGVTFDSNFVFSTEIHVHGPSLVPKHLELSLQQEYGLKSGSYVLGRARLDLSDCVRTGGGHRELDLQGKSGVIGTLKLDVVTKCISDVDIKELERLCENIHIPGLVSFSDRLSLSAPVSASAEEEKESLPDHSAWRRTTSHTHSCDSSRAAKGCECDENDDEDDFSDDVRCQEWLCKNKTERKKSNPVYIRRNNLRNFFFFLRFSSYEFL
eukprot:Rmarinus@m.778